MPYPAGTVSSSRWRGFDRDQKAKPILPHWKVRAGYDSGMVNSDHAPKNAKSCVIIASPACSRAQFGLPSAIGVGEGQETYRLRWPSSHYLIAT
jgi:hypothetical protein